MRAPKDVKIKENLDKIDTLLKDQDTYYQLGFLKGWLARLAAVDITVEQELDARLLNETKNKS